MGFVNKILKYNTSDIYQSENILTEIFAYLFDNNNEFMRSIINMIVGNSIHSLQKKYIKTQFLLEALKKYNHGFGSIIDIVIKVEVNNQEYTIFIENKVDSREHDDQLVRYADHLFEQIDRNKSYGILVYLTRDYDPKKANEIFVNVKKGSRLQFKQLRWHNIFSLIKNNNSELVNELKIYLEENNMSRSNNFSAIDILTFNNMQRLLSKLQDCFDELIYGYNEIRPNYRPSSPNQGNQIIKKNRFYYSTTNNDFEIGYGVFGSEELTDLHSYPKVGVLLWFNKDYDERIKLFEFLKLKNANWTDAEYMSIERLESLEYFINTKDHFDKIKRYILESFNHLLEAKQNYPNLPW